MIHLESRSNGVVLPIRVQPGARRSGITGGHAGSLKVAVTQAAERGKANAAAFETLCEALSLRPRQLELISGSAYRQKKLLVRDITLEELSERIEQALTHT
jgi:uncharacterized protein (TIGR00251 family)